VATVLVVDDEFGILQVLTEILTESNYTVLTAINGRQALEKLRTSHVDVVLTDYMMPSLDGPGLIAAMRAEAATRFTPVVLMSSLPPAYIDTHLAGQSLFLRKPFRVTTVLETIAAALATAPRVVAPGPSGTEG
jgi:CheY-like chemotaxis protein